MQTTTNKQCAPVSTRLSQLKHSLTVSLYTPFPSLSLISLLAPSLIFHISHARYLSINSSRERAKDSGERKNIAMEKRYFPSFLLQLHLDKEARAYADPLSSPDPFFGSIETKRDLFSVMFHIFPFRASSSSAMSKCIRSIAPLFLDTKRVILKVL